MNMSKIESILVVWFITAAAAAAANIGKPIDVGGFLLALIFIVVGLIITGLITFYGNDAGSIQLSAAQKAKRSNRVDALLDLLSDDDLDALSRRLTDRAGEDEPVALDQVLADDGELRRRAR